MEQQLEYMKREAVKATSEGLLRLASKGGYFSELFSDPCQVSFFLKIVKGEAQLFYSFAETKVEIQKKRFSFI